MVGKLYLSIRPRLLRLPFSIFLIAQNIVSVAFLGGMTVEKTLLLKDNKIKMIHCIRTNSTNENFIELVKELDKDLSIRDGADHSFYAPFNKIDKIKYVIVAIENEQAIGCGAIKEYSPEAMEVKRMYVLPYRRGQGIASIILKELELWAVELSYKKCLLETGKKQPEAIALYKKNGYQIIPNFGQYQQVENSICLQKTLPV